jgi:signal transduction histidine kinase
VSFRGRLLIAFLLVVLVPLAVLAIGVRKEMNVRVRAQSDRRAQALAGVIDNDLAEAHRDVGAAVAAVAAALPDDGNFRSGVLRAGSSDRSYVLDYAGRAMRASGLSMLQIRNDSGRIVSSGHFPAEFDRIDSMLPRSLAPFRGPTLLATRTAEGSLISVARLDSVSLGGRFFTVVGGRVVDQHFVDRLAAGGELGVILTLPQTALRSRQPGDSSPADTLAPRERIRVIRLPYVDATTDAATPGTAELAITRSLVDADELRRSVDRWIVIAFLVATAAAVLVALGLAARLSRPMEELALATSTVDLDRLDVRFATGRDDEIGVLSRRLSSMVERLRGSAVRLREAERRATVGDVARQVNHDIKNGLAPIRNVVRHLAQVARDQPGELPAIFTARQGTLDSSIAYLETLAQNYARLTPSLVTRPSDVGVVIAEVIGNTGGRSAAVRAQVAPGLAPVLADAVVLRRILENLVGNAIDSLDGKAGEVTVSAEGVADQRGNPLVRITVADTGRGMNETELARAFDDFYTTKPNGTGLGLSVVRRLVADLGGALRVETEPGNGTRISVDLPTGITAPNTRSTVSR